MEKPFIKLFRSPYSGYFYDVGKNDVIRIPDNVYQHLSKVLDGLAYLGQPQDDETNQLIKGFINLGYLSPERPMKIWHSASNMVPLLLERCLGKITLQLTQDCNFRCKYCIYSEAKNLKQRSHTNKAMTIDTAKKAVIFYRNHAINANMYNVGFYGGEPLLEWELLKETVLFAERELAGKLLTFSLTTNASLLTEAKAAFLEEHGVNVLVSLDGDRTENDHNRVFKCGKGTSDMVLDNLQIIAERHPKLFSKISISSVITPSTQATTFGIYPKEIEGIPFSRYMITIEDSTEHDVIIPLELLKAMENEVCKAYLKQLGVLPCNISPYGYSRVHSIINNYKSAKPSNGIQRIMAPGGPCIPGKSRLFVSADGSLYPCERVNETSEFCIGTLDSGFDFEKAQKMLNIGAITEKDCSNCWALRHCTICAKSCGYLSCDAPAEKRKLCDSVRNNTTEKIRAMILLSEAESFFDQYC